jgi:hypothetical protein
MTPETSTIHASHSFVLEQAKANIAFVRANAEHVEQAKQINASLANIVAMERNLVMHNALERAKLKELNEDMQKLLKH